MTFRVKVPACAVLAAGLVIMLGCARGGVAVDADRGVYLVIVGTAPALVLAAWGLMFLLGARATAVLAVLGYRLVGCCCCCLPVPWPTFASNPKEAPGESAPRPDGRRLRLAAR